MATTINAPRTPDQQLKWYQGLDRYCWVVLSIAALGWLFDMMDQNLYTLVRVPSLRSIMAADYPDPAALNAAVIKVGGWITAIFMVGWAVGGFIFGILGDRLGRTKTMILSILIYAIFTGLNGLVHSWPAYATVRFMTALGVGGEWAAAAALVAEVFPQRSRAMALGSLQALSAVGNMMAACLTLSIGNMDARWRWVYFIGAAPAVLVIWVMKSVHEPEIWQQAKAKATVGREMGSLGELFRNPILRRHTISGVLLATAGLGGLWGVSYFSPDMLRSELSKAHWTPQAMTGSMSISFLLQQIGAFLGLYAFALVAERIGRRPTFYVWFSLSWASVVIFFWSVYDSGGGAAMRAYMLAPLLGFCTSSTLGGFTIYFPELFPTRLRTTGCGFCYNSARIFAAVAPWMLGSLSTYFKSGYPMAATIVGSIYMLGILGAWIGPETIGKPLPEDVDFEESL